MSDAYEGGAGPPLVLLHGIGGSWHIWKPVIPLLEPHHQVFAPTLPGHRGGPKWPLDRPTTISALAELLHEELAARGLARSHIAGNSLGGWLALELLRRGGASSVTALSPAGAWRGERDYMAVARPFRIAHAAMPVVLRMARPLLRFARFRRMLNAQAMNNGDRMTPEEALGAMQAIAGASIIPGLLASMRTDGPIRPLDAGEAPVTIAWCADDGVIPFATYGEPMLEAVAGALAVTLRAVGHVPMYDDPAQVADVILATTSRADDNLS